MELAIRRATDADLDALAALERSAFGATAWSPEQLTGTFRAARSLAWLVRPIAADRAMPAGYALFSTVADEAELLRVAVEPRWRRQGVAAALLTTALVTLRDDGVGRCFLEVAEGNRPAVALYRRLGFHEVGRRPRYYRDGAAARLFEWTARPREAGPVAGD